MIKYLHSMIRISDPEATLAFFKLLGLEEVRRMEHEKGRFTLYFLAAPGQYVNNVEFHRKIVLIVIAGFNVLYFMLVDEGWTMGPDDNAPLRTKIAAASAVVLWIGILYYGHMLPFLGNAF